MGAHTQGVKMKLSGEEFNIIKKHRAEVELKERQYFFKTEILRLATSFSLWNESRGMELTLSVFIDDFGAEDIIHNSLVENIDAAYKAVREVVEVAERNSKITGL